MNLVQIYSSLGAFDNVADKAQISKTANIIFKSLPSDLSKVGFVCMGTNQVIGDSLGLHVSKYLIAQGVQNVHGTFEDPCHGANIKEKIKTIEYPFLIVVNTCAAKCPENVGLIGAKAIPMQLGRGVGRTDLPTIGDFSISGASFYPGEFPSWALNMVRPEVIERLAMLIGMSIMAAFRMHEHQKRYDNVL